jgi:hypothetical protein
MSSARGASSGSGRFASKQGGRLRILVSRRGFSLSIRCVSSGVEIPRGPGAQKPTREFQPTPSASSRLAISIKYSRTWASEWSRAKGRSFDSSMLLASAILTALRYSAGEAPRALRATTNPNVRFTPSRRFLSNWTPYSNARISPMPSGTPTNSPPFTLSRWPQLPIETYGEHHAQLSRRSKPAAAAYVPAPSSNNTTPETFPGARKATSAGPLNSQSRSRSGFGNGS